MKHRLPPARRRSVPAPGPSLSSLDLLLQVIMLERGKQLAHFDGLDAKLDSVGGILAVGCLWPCRWASLAGICESCEILRSA